MRAVPSSAALVKRNRPEPAGVPAVVSRAPATTDDPVFVTWTSIDEEDGDERKIEEQCLWSRRGVALPAVGDSALLLLDTIGDAYALVF
jgi:hypothetical protein